MTANFLFLDRDGVINDEYPGDYIRNWNQFVFLEKALEAMAMLSKKFKRIFIVTNQRGVGLGLMTQKNLDDIHRNMMFVISAHSGRIDKIYSCTDTDRETSLCRKPKIAMAEQAKKDFPEIDFAQSIMVGNRQSDMEFGRNAGMKTVFITNQKNPKDCSPDLIDFSFPSLIEFARQFGKT